MDYEVINPDHWKRKELYHFFRSFEEPFTGIVADVDVSQAKVFCKENQVSFFQFYLYKSLIAVNRTEAFRLRIIDDEIRKYKTIHASSTIPREDGTFGFSYIAFDSDFRIFSQNLLDEKLRIQTDRSLFPPVHSHSVVHYSSMPWITFTSVSHARKFSIEDASPKISFGKVYERENRFLMPVSVHVHHALVDGRDIGEFIERFQNCLNEK